MVAFSLFSSSWITNETSFDRVEAAGFKTEGARLTVRLAAAGSGARAAVGSRTEGARLTVRLAAAGRDSTTTADSRADVDGVRLIA